MTVPKKVYLLKSNESFPKQKSSDSYDFNQLEDKDIWSSFKSGNEDALIFIYSKYVHGLFNFGCQCTSNQELVKDCIQELFISLQFKKGVRAVQNIKPYLFKCLRREIFRALKKQSRYFLKAQVDEYDIFQIELQWDEKMIEDQLSEERKILLREAITKLTSKQREAIMYYYYEGFTYTEIADIMNMSSVVTARKLIYRAIDSLKLAMNESRVQLQFTIHGVLP